MDTSLSVLERLGDFIIRSQDLSAATGLSPSTIRRRIEEGEFPKPVKLGSGKISVVGWKASDIRQWLAARPYVK